MLRKCTHLRICTIHLYVTVAFIITTNGNDNTEDYVRNETDEMQRDFDVFEWPDFHLEQAETSEMTIAHDGTLETMVPISQTLPENDDVADGRNNVMMEFESDLNLSDFDMEFESDLNLSNFEWNWDEAPNIHISKEFPVFAINSGIADTYTGSAADNPIIAANEEDVNVIAAEDANVIAAEYVSVVADEGVNVIAAEDVNVFPAEDVNVVAVEDDNVVAAEDVNFVAAEDANVAAAHDVNFVAAEDVNVSAAHDVNVAAAEAVNIAAAHDVNVAAAEDVNVVAAEDLVIAAEDVNVIAAEDANVAAAEDVNVVAAEDVNVIAAEDVNVAAAEDVNFVAAEDVNVAAAHDVNFVAAEDVNVAAAEDVNVVAAEDLVIARNVPESGEILRSKGSEANFCHACEKSFRFQKDYVDHCLKKHNIRKPYGCLHCSKNYSVKKLLVKHVKKIHGGSGVYSLRNFRQPVSCVACHLTVNGWCALEEHNLTAHSGVKMMACSQCPKRYFRRQALKTHVKKMHNDSRLKCVHCNDIFQGMSASKYHEKGCEVGLARAKEMTTCKKSEEGFESYEHSEDHRASKHAGTSCFSSGNCGEEFFPKKTSGTHVKNAYAYETKNLTSSSLENMGDNDDDVKFDQHVCQYCKKKFWKLGEYENHGMMAHPKQPMFFCRECGKGYCHRSGIRLHVKETHEKIKKRCLHCTKWFSTSTLLLKHQQRCQKRSEKTAVLMNAGKPGRYCQVCRKVLYMKRNTFLTHIWRHNEYEFCSVCGEGFHKLNNPNGLNEHLLKRHDHESTKDDLTRIVADTEVTAVTTES